MKRCLVYVFALLAAAGPAIAQSTTVQVPVGAWLDAAAPTIGTLLLGLFMWGFRRLPDAVQTFFRTMQVEQMMAKAIDFGINRVKGASKDKVLEVDVGNAVIAEASRYVLTNGPGWMRDWLGDEKGIKDRILARLDLTPEAGLSPTDIAQR